MYVLWYNSSKLSLVLFSAFSMCFASYYMYMYNLVKFDIETIANEAHT